MKKHYFVKHGNFGNVYSLRWADNKNDIETAEKRGYEQITRKEAIQLCRDERHRRANDRAFSGYADAMVYHISHDPYNPNCYPETKDASGYIVLA